MFAIVPNDEETVWSEMSISVPTDKESYYVRNFGTSSYVQTAATPQAVTDLKTTDMGVLFYSTNYASANNIGEIYVCYEIELTDPTANPGPYAGELYNSNTSIAALWPQTPQTISIGSVLADTNLVNSFAILAPGSYIVTLLLVGTVMTATPPSIGDTLGTLTVTATLSSYFTNAAATRSLISLQVNVTTDPSTGVYIGTWTVSSTATTIVGAFMYLSPAGVNTLV
jgi:hypothetical protein